MPVYNVFGLRLSTAQPIVELSSVQASLQENATTPVDVVVDCERDWQVALQSAAPRKVVYISQEFVEADKPALQVWRIGDGTHHLVYGDGIQFLVGKDGERIGVMWPQEAAFTDALPYLLGPVLGLVIRLRGGVCLHASAIAHGDRAALLVGPMGAGKSSTALAFARLGCEILSDDVAALTHRGNCFAVQPAYPGLRLWPDMAQTLLGHQVELPRIVPAWEKRRLDLVDNGYRFRSTLTPIAAIYLLNERTENSIAPEVTPLAPADALLRLIANGYVRYLLDRPMRALEFDLLGQLVQHVPVRQATPHTDPSRLSSFCNAILDDLRSVQTCQPLQATAF